MTVKSIVDEEIVSGLMMNTTTVVFRQVEPETLGLEINQYVPIPSIGKVDEKQGFIMQQILYHVFIKGSGKIGH